MRELQGHKTNPANAELSIAVLDAPGSGGAHHLYIVSGFDTKTNPCDPFKDAYGRSAAHSTILFQNGPISEVGVNGLTHEVLLAILIDRLECFQRGPYACEENGTALHHLIEALNALKSRTAARIARGVEGTHNL